MGGTRGRGQYIAIPTAVPPSRRSSVPPYLLPFPPSLRPAVPPFLRPPLYNLLLLKGLQILFRIANAFKLKTISTTLYILIGIIFYAILKFLPVIGPIMLISMNILEIGIGTSYLLRKRLRMTQT